MRIARMLALLIGTTLALAACHGTMTQPASTGDQATPTHSGGGGY